MRVPKISPARRSEILSVLGGMMAAAYLHGQGIVDLSYGFQKGGLAEGAVIAITGSLAGYGVMLAFRKLRDIARHDNK